MHFSQTTGLEFHDCSSDRFGNRKISRIYNLNVSSASGSNRRFQTGCWKKERAAPIKCSKRGCNGAAARRAFQDARIRTGSILENLGGIESKVLGQNVGRSMLDPVVYVKGRSYSVEVGIVKEQEVLIVFFYALNDVWFTFGKVPDVTCCGIEDFIATIIVDRANLERGKMLSKTLRGRVSRGSKSIPARSQRSQSPIQPIAS